MKNKSFKFIADTWYGSVYITFGTNKSNSFQISTWSTSQTTQICVFTDVGEGYDFVEANKLQRVGIVQGNAIHIQKADFKMNSEYQLLKGYFRVYAPKYMGDVDMSGKVPSVVFINADDSIPDE